ncbi:MAG: carboxypeptidase regulatory-like domain-containing protein [Bradyrhizobium sp.]
MSIVAVLPPVTAHGARGMQVSKQSAQGATRLDPLRLSLQFAQGNMAPKPMVRACPGTQAESRYDIRRLPTELVTIPSESSFNATKTNFTGEKQMRSKLMLSLTASAALMLFHPVTQMVWAQDQAALTGTVSSDAEGNMEGVVVTARKPGSIIQVSVTTDAQGRYTFPEGRLDPGEYTISIRAVGYDIGSETKAILEPETSATKDVKLKKTKNLASQLTNAEWMMSIPGTEEQKAMLLNCVGCHTIERIMRSTHDSDEWTQVITRMMGYGAVSQPIKPQPMLDRARAGTPEQYRKMADYLATINLSSVDYWQYELKTLPRPKGRDTRAIVTEYDMVRPTTEPHDILVDKEGNVWYSDFGEMFIGKFDPKTLKLTEYPIKKFKDKAPTGLLRIHFDHIGKIWFDTM